MTPANFPSRKNQRRLRALARFPKGPSRKGCRTEGRRLAELMRLRTSILSEAQARSIRTKKDRSARAKLAR